VNSKNKPKQKEKYSVKNVKKKEGSPKEVVDLD